MASRIQRYLSKSPTYMLVLFASIAAFSTYFCMYAFRKPFSVATFEGEAEIWGLNYKIFLVIAQVVGYMLSKFIGIKVVSEMQAQSRALAIVGLIGAAELALLFFAITPSPWNAAFLFLNGIPLGMIWGIVFSYLEGRTVSEILAAGLSASFIVASGAVKSVGDALMLHAGISEFWMPFVTGLVFVIPLVISVWLLEQIPPPSEKDRAERTPRKPMTGAERKALFLRFAPGIILLVAAYMMLTAFRDYRDNFAKEIWIALGYGDRPDIFTLSELPVAFGVLIIFGATFLIRKNFRAFMTFHVLIGSGILLVGLSTWAFQMGWLSPVWWMILIGLGLYLGYVPFGCILFDRMIGAFQYSSNAGFLIYVADAFGYIGSVAILLYKNVGSPELSWLDFLIQAAYFMTFFGGALLIAGGLYFWRKHQAFQRQVEAVSTP
ncbi:MAG: DUF5690 family protein [Bacteroidota bacterium]